MMFALSRRRKENSRIDSLEYFLLFFKKFIMAIYRRLFFVRAILRFQNNSANSTISKQLQIDHFLVSHVSNDYLYDEIHNNMRKKMELREREREGGERRGKKEERETNKKTEKSRRKRESVSVKGTKREREE